MINTKKLEDMTPKELVMAIANLAVEMAGVIHTTVSGLPENLSAEEAVAAMQMSNFKDAENQIDDLEVVANTYIAELENRGNK